MLLAGLQRSVICLGGGPVALAGQGHLLAAVWHAAAPAPSGEQQLAYAVGRWVGKEATAPLPAVVSSSANSAPEYVGTCCPACMLS